MIAENTSLLDRVPDPPQIKRRMVALATELNYLRRLLKVAERKPRLPAESRGEHAEKCSVKTERSR